MISVIIPYWNAEGWIARCAHSLQKAKGDFEFILVNDNSTDRSEEILKGYIDDRFVRLNNQHRKGVGGARNTGLDWARGEWITFLDVDDVLLSDAYEKFKYMIKQQEADIHQADHIRFYETMNRTVLKYSNAPGIYYLGNLPKCWCMVWNKVYRKSLLADIRFDEALQFGEDEVFNVDCIRKCRYIHCSDMITMKRYFDNKGSLAHIKGYEELKKEIHALEEEVAVETDKDMRTMLCRRIAWHWESPTYLEGFYDKARVVGQVKEPL